MMCKRPDRDVRGLVCGYPLPCPWHTVSIDLTTTPAQVAEPITAKLKLRDRRRLLEIADALSESWE